MLNTHIHNAKKQYATIGQDFEAIMGWYLSHGYVLCIPEILILCKDCDSSDITRRFPANPDSLFIEYLSLIPGEVPELFDTRKILRVQYDKVVYCRRFRDNKTRIISMDKFESLIRRT